MAVKKKIKKNARAPKQPGSRKFKFKPYMYIFVVVLVLAGVGAGVYSMRQFFGPEADPEGPTLTRSDTMLTSGQYVDTDLEILENQVWIPAGVVEETPYHGADYSKVWVCRRENGTPRYMFGVIAIPNESNIEYSIEDDMMAVIDVTQEAVTQAIVDVYGGIRPSISCKTERQLLFDQYDSLEQTGDFYLNISFLEFTDGDTSGEVKVDYTEEPNPFFYYSQAIVYRGQPVVAWGAWEYTVPLATINMEQSVVDCIASVVGEPTVDMADAQLIKPEGPDTKIVWDDAKQAWVVDSTGEEIPEIPPSTNPDFFDKYQDWAARIRDEWDAAHPQDSESTMDVPLLEGEQVGSVEGALGSSIPEGAEP